MSINKKESGEKNLKSDVNQIIYHYDVLEPKISNVPEMPSLLWEPGRISKFILKSYFSLLPKDQNSSDRSIYSFYPYLISVYGAYPFMPSWKMLMDRMKDTQDEIENSKGTYPWSGKREFKERIGMLTFNTISFNSNTIDYKEYQKEVVLERLKEFAKGFEFGYHSFLENCVHSQEAISNSEIFMVQRIMDYLERSRMRQNSFPIINIEDSNETRIQEWYNYGISTGYNYHAWYLVFMHHKLFEPHFAVNESSSESDKKLNLHSIFIDDKAFTVCKSLMEELEITIDGRPNLKAGRIGKLTGLITAIINYRHLMLQKESLSESQLLDYFNSFLNTNYKTFSKRNKAYEPTIQDAEVFIKKHLKK